MNQNLEDQLKKYSESGIYPFHMPGHKRRDHALLDPYSMDITEIEGYDNLHQPKGVLLKAKERLADLYGAEESFFLVNGSTCGILAAISAAVKRGDQILAARNCHKAVYHAIELLELQAEYLYPVISGQGIQGMISAEEVREALKRSPGCKAVILTSPTYDGVLSDIKSISDIVHEKKIPLIVDEAHGAHLGFWRSFPKSAVTEGADVVIQSFHKTLPSLTQTAVLHRTSERISPKKIQKYLSVYQTSSPSYLLMASIDRCVRILEEERAEYFSEYEKNLNFFYERVQGLKNLKVLKRNDFSREEAYRIDPSKILIYTGYTKMTGAALMNCLRKDWKLELEMASGYYALAMTSIMDSREGFSHLAKALISLDRQVKPAERNDSFYFIRDLYGKKKAEYPIWKAEEMEIEEIPLEKAEGRIAAETCFIYPPGIPLLLPGERIEKDFLKRLKECREKHLQLTGLSDWKIKVIIT